MSIIQLKDLSFSYKDKSGGGFGPRVLKDLTLDIEQGSLIGIAGATACGKTTLCHIICGIIPHYFDGKMTGSITVMGRKPWREDPSLFSQCAVYVGQSNSREFATLAVEDELAFAPENLCINARELDNIVDDTMKLLDIEYLRGRNPLTLSASEQKLVAIGAAMTMNPEVLVIDESPRGFKKSTRGRIARLFRELKRYGKTVIVTGTDPAELEYTDEVLIMRDGRIIGTHSGKGFWF